MANNELYHHGILGMKWGVRRTPEELGHGPSTKKSSRVGSAVKSAAKKIGTAVSESRAKRKQAKFEEKARAKSVKRTQSLKKKNISEMTNEELSERIERMRLEKMYRDLQPQKVSAGKQFISSFGNQVIAPAVLNTSRQLLEKSLRKTLGLEQINTDPLKALRDEVDVLNLKSQKATYLNNIDRNDRERADRAKADKEAKNKQQNQQKNNQQNQQQSQQTQQTQQPREPQNGYQKSRPQYAEADSYEVPPRQSTKSGKSWVNDYVDVTDYRYADEGASYVKGLLGSGDDEKKRYR